ncbi:hypothetical protein MASR2M64_06810 [Candidatus Cloacimonadota bacterium]
MTTGYLSPDGILNLNLNTEERKNNVTSYIRDYPRMTSVEQNPSFSKSTGTGFLLSTKGYIVTNLHVVKDALNIYVVDHNSNKNRLNATIIVSDTNNDLCILKVEGLSLDTTKALPYGFDVTLNRTGESVFCMGYPLTQAMGNEIKVTNGIISAVTGYQGDVSCYQVSTPVQPGNSGGPLFNSSGNVIGIVNAKIPQAENVSYAVKSSYITNILGLLNDNITLTKLNQNNRSLPSMVESFKCAVYIIDAEF